MRSSGFSPHERTVPQPIEVDLVVRVGAGDAIIDYRELYALTAETLAAGPIDFLEEVGRSRGSARARPQ